VKELFADEYYTLRADGGILRLVRSPAVYPTLQALDRANRGMIDAVRASGCKRLLLDLRAGPPGRNDPAFEAAVAPWRAELAAATERVALLVRTVAGRLQTQRMARTQGRAEATFLDEDEALAFLRKP
jgi:hypothetical protein